MPNAPTGQNTCDSTGDSFVREAVATSEPGAEAFTLPPSLRPGDVMAGRFVVERLAGRGGMGAVYRALDRMTGSPVALKVMARQGDRDDRFAQEARVLAELNHPAIVRYVAHGATAEGQPFLAMEWLEGEDLAERRTRAGLSVAESLTVARRVAEGLGAAHARSVIHRDVKPSNVFLVDGDPARAKLLDFGIVRLQLSARNPTALPMTRTGMILGTVGYMSPEQATADRTLDVRTDIFALGCVLFECLTGQPAFSGAHVVAVLAKVLREEAPRLRQLRPDLPAALDDLVARMLSKDKVARPANGAALLGQLEALGSITAEAPDAPPRSHGLSASEQRLVTVMMAADLEESERVREVVLRHGGELVRLANRALLVTMSGRGSTSEQAVAAAVCALELVRAFPASRIALSIGKAQTMSGGPPGPVIDQAAALLARSRSAGIRVDDAMAAVLGERFDVGADEVGASLVGRRADTEPPRTLLGKATPCVGRDKELTLLAGTLRECVEESVARAVLVTGPAGQGKSRLRYEFVADARQRGDVRILAARGDPVGAGSAFTMVRQLVRQAAGLREGDPAPEQQARLRAYVAEVCKDGNFARIADFLGELIGAPSREKPSSELQSARNDPQFMAVWLARSFGEWLAAECSARPLLLVLEDLDWGDFPSVNYVGDGLRTLRAKPLMVLALGRPEVRETFPNLWPGTEVHEIPLSRLTPRAAERLARASLGETVSTETVTRVVERADGNAFYLEELIRRVSEGGGDKLPDTVLALVQSRLERLESEARRIVRAASVFGEVFWRGGVTALLGTDVDLDERLQALTEREVFATMHGARFPGEREYAFRHSIMREAAYAMLTDLDRSTGHQLACDWLEAAGENAAILARHSQEGGDFTAAAMHHIRAGDFGTGMCSYDEARRHYSSARAALAQLPEDNSMRRRKVDTLLKEIFVSLVADMADVNFRRAAEARALLEKIVETAPLSGHIDERLAAGRWQAEDMRRLARIDYYCGRIHFYRSETHKAIEYYRKVLEAGLGRDEIDDELIGLPSCLIGTATLIQGHAKEAEPLLAQSIGPIERQGEPFEWFRAVGYHAVCLTLLGRCNDGQKQLDRIVARALEVQKPNLMAATCIMTGTTHLLAGDWPRALSFLEQARASAIQTGDKLHLNLAWSGLGWTASNMGRHEEAHAARAEARRIAAAMGGRLMLDDWYRAADAEIAFNGGELDRALELARAVAKSSEAEGLLVSQGIAERVAGEVLLARGRWEEAEGCMRRSIAVLENGSLRVLATRTKLSWARQLRRSDGFGAGRLFEEALAEFETFGCDYAREEAARSWGS